MFSGIPKNNCPDEIGNGTAPTGLISVNLREEKIQF